MLSAFTDLATLERHMVTSTYIDGAIPTKRDISVFRAICPPPGPEHPNASRWYKHIASFSQTTIEQLPGVIEKLSPSLPAASAKVAAPPAPEPAAPKEPKAKAAKEPKGAPPAPKGAPPAPTAAKEQATAKPAAKGAAKEGGDASQMELALRAALEADGSVANSLDFATSHSFDHAALIGVCKSLASNENIATEAMSKTMVQLSKEGHECVEQGSPEARVFAMVPAGEGILQEDLMAAAGAAGKVGMAKCVQNKWVEVVKEEGVAPAPAEGGKKPSVPKRVKRLVPSVDDAVARQLRDVLSSGGATDALPAEALAALKKRSLLTVATVKSVRILKGAAFATWGQKAHTDLTHEMLVKGSWRQAAFKPLNLDAAGKPPAGGALHPLMKVRALFREIFLQSGFEEMETNKFVESSFWNFDALFQPQQHPARDEHDTFFVKMPATTLALPDEYLQRVKATHEDGGASLGAEYAAASTGWRYEWSEEVTRQNLLRTHTTAVSSRTLYKLAQLAKEGGSFVKPQKYFSIDRVFRNEALDATHLAEFHQVEGFVIGEDLSLGHLMGTIADFYKRLGPEFDDIKFKPTYNPYTEPSMEFCCWHPTLKKWVETGNSGVFRPEMLRPMGFPPNVSVIAWGMSLERPTMIKYKFKDIRTLFGHRSDINNVIRAHPIVRWT